MSTLADYKLASVAAGFTLGFGILTVWEAIKQTRAVRSPLRSHYIYMVWGEIATNLAIAIIAWLLLDGTLLPTVPVLFGALVCWVFEIQLLMQIIINRTAVIVDDRRWMNKIKWGTAALITCVNIGVFCIWIPTHATPPSPPIFAEINQYWDRTSKVIILLVDAGLNYYFIRSVRLRLVKFHGLVKYQPLVTFNTRLMILSIAMDGMIIGLMHLPNPLVYTQFHPVAYMVKLNIEMTMASLIKKIAQASVSERDAEGMGRYHHTHDSTAGNRTHNSGILRSGNFVSAKSPQKVSITSIELDSDHIHTTTEVQVKHENAASIDTVDKDSISAVEAGVYESFDHRRPHEQRIGVAKRQSIDELPLAR